MVVTLFPPLIKTAAVLPKTTTTGIITSIKSFFTSLSPISKTALKTGAAVGGGGFLASIGLSSLADTLSPLDDIVGIEGTGLIVIVAIIILILILLVKR